MSWTRKSSSVRLSSSPRSRAAEQREEVLPLHRLLHGGHGFVAGNLFAAEEALEQRVIGGGNRLDHLLVVLLEPGALALRDIRLLVLTRLGARLEDVRLLGEEVDDALEARASPDGDLDRNDLGRELVLDGLVGRVEVRVFLVHHRDHEEHRIAAANGLEEIPFGAHLHTVGGADGHQRAVGGREAGDRVTLKVQKPGRVDEVDLGVAPLGEGTAHGN